MRDLLDDVRLTAADGASLAMLAQQLVVGADIVIGSPLSAAGREVAAELASRHGFKLEAKGALPVAHRVRKRG